MSSNQPVQASVLRPRSTVLVALIAVVVLACVLAIRAATGASPEARSPRSLRSTDGHNVVERGAPRHDERLRASAPGEPGGGLQSRALGAADGEVADGTTVFADVPAVANLDPALLTALRKAASGAAANGVELDVNSGWRSYKYQEQLFDDAVARYGSAAEAGRWVARPGTSVHEAGDAVDIGPSSATTWLGRNGATFALCQIYDNEPWHFELRPDAVAHGCPTSYADPSHDPRMQR